MSNNKRNKADVAEEPQPKKGKLWGGRFTGKTDELFEQFNASIGFDKIMWKADLTGSKAYARALAKAKVITDEECARLVEGLEQVGQEWEAGKFEIKVESDEDIHTANERRLAELVGSVAGKLHTGRSRNDQVATDLRIWCLEEGQLLKQELLELIGTIVRRAEEDIHVLMPGFTHLQPAQPIRWSHFLLSYGFSFQRDAQRLDDALKRVGVLPLGSGALAGNAFAIDRLALAKDLSFPLISGNSLDAVSDRDFVAEMLFVASLTLVHISQWAEDLIIFCSKKYVVCADAYSTGSSLMPQKKNPDALELLRGKSGRVLGALNAILVLLKGLPKAYNKDLQEDKEQLFDGVATLHGCLKIAAGVVSTVVVREERMRQDLFPEMLATDLAEYLVRKGVPFRETHHVAGAAVKLAEDKQVPLSSLSFEELKTLHPDFQPDVRALWDFENSVESRSTTGGTARKAVLEAIETLNHWISNQ